MSVWLRLGPFGISSRGRKSVRVGPLSFYGGGRRRRRRRRSRSSGGNTGAGVLVFIVVVVIALIVAGVKGVWRHSHAGAIVLSVFLGLLAVLLIGVAIKTASENAKRRKVVQETTRKQLVSLHSKLPARVTANWIRQYVPTLPADEVPHLIRELQRRGWKSQDIEIKVLPYVR